MKKAKSKIGIGTVLVALYGILAFAATGRSSYELVAKFDQAPLPYALSAFSALVYLVATFALAKNSPLSRKLAWATVSIELIGVLVVGTASVLAKNAFTYNQVPVHTVWSYFGIGYGFVPVLLPILGLVYLAKTRRA